MSARFPIYPAHTAVLSMDCQSGIVSVYLKDDKDSPPLQQVEETKTCGGDKRPKSLFYEGSRIRPGQERHERRA
jgi:hypothetical protein